MSRRKKTTEWPEGFEAYIRGRRFTDMEELLLWDCSVMHECFQEALARWEAQVGGTHQAQMRPEDWKAVRAIADEISLERSGVPLRMHAIRWGCRLAERLEQRFMNGAADSRSKAGSRHPVAIKGGSWVLGFGLASLVNRNKRIRL